MKYFNFFLIYSFFYISALSYVLFEGSFIYQHFNLVLFDLFKFNDISIKLNLFHIILNPRNYDFELYIPTRTAVNDIIILNSTIHHSNNNAISIKTYDEMYTAFLCLYSVICFIQICFMYYTYKIQSGKYTYNYKKYIGLFSINLFIKISLLVYFLAKKPLNYYCIQNSSYEKLIDDNCIYDSGFYVYCFLIGIHSLVISAHYFEKIRIGKIKYRKITSINGIGITEETISYIYDTTDFHIPLICNSESNNDV